MSPQLQQALFKITQSAVGIGVLRPGLETNSTADCFVHFYEDLKGDQSVFLTPDLLSDFCLRTGPVPSAVVIKALHII